MLADFRTFQQIVLVGYVGSDPRVFTYDDGNFTVHMRVATNHIPRDAKPGSDSRVTTWHRVRLYRRAAAYAREWIRKGDRVMVVGAVHYWKEQSEPGEKSERMGCEIRSGFVMAMDDHRHSEAAKLLGALQQYDIHPESWTGEVDPGPTPGGL